MSWSAAQYTKFEDERNRPVKDLLARIPTSPVRIAVDIGCGPGNSTELLCDRYPQASVFGMDSSPDMIEAARTRLPDVRFEMDDIGTWRNQGPFDLILANAVLQWVPDHATIFPSLISRLAAGGTLAVQMPDNLDEPAHRLMREVAADGPWADKLRKASAVREARHSADWYYSTLRGMAEMDIWRTIYHHPLAGGAGAVVEWFKGSGLRPYLNALDREEQEAFLARYTAGIAQAYPALADGTVLLPFPRLFVIATR